MKLVTALLIATLAATGISTAYANDNDDRIEQQIYADAQFEQKKQEAIAMLQKRGYQVKEVEADAHKGKPTLDIKAFKNGQKYDIKMAYPSLKIIRERLDD